MTILHRMCRIGLYLAIAVTSTTISLSPAHAQQGINLAGCKGLWFSTSEDFLSRGTELPGGPIVSDGDLLSFETGSGTQLCARNGELLQGFDTNRFDHGLDALDQVVIDEDQILAAFSTEINSVNGAAQFTAGDLLFTHGAIIPNSALLVKFGLPRSLNLGLDAVSIEGSTPEIRDFLEKLSGVDVDDLRNNPELLIDILEGTNTDILFSTEGTPPDVQQPLFLDGDLLSAKNGVIVRSNANLLPALPAGLPSRGVDYGLDAYTPAYDSIEQVPIELFSIEIQAGDKSISDGDALTVGPGIYLRNKDLIGSFEPLDIDMGLDALADRAVEVSHCGFRITSISHVDVASRLDQATGLFDQNLEGTRDYAFGGDVRIQGEVPGRDCPEYPTHEFRIRVNFGTADTTILHSAALQWMTLEPPCLGLTTPYADNGGWFALTQYQRVIDCANDESLAVWRSRNDVSGDVADAFLWIELRPIGSAGPVQQSAAVHIKIDNKKPDNVIMALYRAGETDPIADQCQIAGNGDPVELDIKGNFHDDHFRTYTLSWTTDGNMSGTVPATIGHDYNSRPELSDTGTVPTVPPPHVLLETFNLPVLIECGYTITMVVYDRTRIGSMHWAENNFSYSNSGNWTRYSQSFCLQP